MKGIVTLVGVLGFVMSSTVALAAAPVPAPMPIGLDMAGAWQCTSADNAQHQWIHEGPSQMLAEKWAVNLCGVDSDVPRSCHLLAGSCHPVEVSGRWRCFAADYREHIHWQAIQKAPRWHAIHDAYQRCYRHSHRPDTCYVNPAGCVHYK